MKMAKKKSRGFKDGGPRVILGRLPLWISQQKSVQVTLKLRETIITSLPSSPNQYEFRSMNSFCNSNSVEDPKQDVDNGKRLTRSTGGAMNVDFNAKLPDDRNYRCKILGPCSYPFLGFDSCHHAIYLSNNEVFQFLSKVEDKMDIVMNMVDLDIDCFEVNPNGETMSPAKVKQLTMPPDKNNSMKCELINKGRKIFQKTSSGHVGSQSNDMIKGDTEVNAELIRVKSECGNDFCRLGCMCESLKAKRKRTHCGHADCMFSKKCIGPNVLQSDANKLTLLCQTTNSPESEGVPTKRQRRPPRRWVEEEEELDLLAVVKRKSKFFVHSSPPAKKNKGNDGSIASASALELPDANERGMEPDSLTSLNSSPESSSFIKRPWNIALKSTSGKVTHQVSVLKKNLHGVSKVADDANASGLPKGIATLSSAALHKGTSLIEPPKSDELIPTESNIPAIISRKYIRHYKEYRKMLTCPEVGEKELELMCSDSISPLQMNSIRLMKWEVLEELVTNNAAHLWLSQAPKCLTRIYVSESERPPDVHSVNLKFIDNVCGMASSIDYLFQLYKNEPVRYGCCVLFCHVLYWELKGALNMKTKLGDRNLIKVMRTYSKGTKEMTFANSGKKVMFGDLLVIKNSQNVRFQDTAPKDVMESEINEIPEPDLPVYDANNSQPAESSGSNRVVNHGPASPDTTVPDISYQEEVFTRSMQPKVPQPATPKSLMELSWYCLNLDRSFDKIIIDKPNFSATYSQMVYALQISKEKDIAVRITCSGGSNYMYNSQIWRQGVYADYTLSDNTVKVGPYYNYEVPEIRAFVKINGILCRTYVQLSKEPLNAATLPRVSRSTTRPVNPVNESSSSSTDTAPSDTETQVNETCSSKPIVTEPQVKNIREKNVRTDHRQSVSSTVDDTVTQANTSESISEPTTSEGSVHTELEPRVEEPKEEEPASDGSSQPNFSIKIESVLGNWSGFNDIVNPAADDLEGTKEMVVAPKPSKSLLKTRVPRVPIVKSGYLVSEVPDLMAIAATKEGKSQKNVKNITIVDSSFNIRDTPLTFKGIETAIIYLNSIIKVKWYPDDYKMNWTFVENREYLEMNRERRILDLRTLTEDQFITAKGVFSYDEVCSDYLTQYGLELVDNRRLLEYKRRRDIRAAKIELTALLPDPKPDVLVKVISRSNAMIRSLEDKGRELLDTLISENSRKGYLLAKLRKMCSGEAMYQIFEKLESISRPRLDHGLEYEDMYQKPRNKKSRPAVPRKMSMPKKRRTKASSVRTKKSPKRKAPPKTAFPNHTQKTLKVLQPVVTTPVSPVKLVIKSPSQQSAFSSTKSAKESRKARRVFSGRLVSAATQRSLRKYKYIIPTLARKQFSNIKEPGNKTSNDEGLVNRTDYQQIPFPSTYHRYLCEDGETDQNISIESHLKVECSEELNEVEAAEASGRAIPSPIPNKVSNLRKPGNETQEDEDFVNPTEYQVIPFPSTYQRYMSEDGETDQDVPAESQMMEECSEELNEVEAPEASGIAIPSPIPNKVSILRIPGNETREREGFVNPTVDQHSVLPSSCQRILCQGDKTDQNVWTESHMSMINSGELSQAKAPEISDVLTNEFAMNETKVKTQRPNCEDNNMTIVEHSVSEQDEVGSMCTDTVEKEDIIIKIEKSSEPDAIELIEYPDLPSVESEIDVGSRDDLFPLNT